MTILQRRHLAVSADEEAALARVDTEAGERVDLDLLYSTNAIRIYSCAPELWTRTIYISEPARETAVS